MAAFMSRPDTRVRIAFDLAAGGAGNFFTLDDPVKGELDNAPFGLSGDILEDVTDDVRSITVRRGRSRELERYQAGAATVNLDNKDRKYDPSYKVTQSATGGDDVYEIQVGARTYVVHEFTTVGTATFTPTTPLLGVEYLVVAGGGGGGANRGAGGGAGGYLAGSTSLDAEAYLIVVGAGGAGGSSTVDAVNGGNSSALGLTAIGGGRGGRATAGSLDGASGGSGGGGSGNSFGSAGTGGAATSGQGNAGGDGLSPGTNSGAGGGGGGAGGSGATATPASGGNGGAGITSSITGTAVGRAGGGGGGIDKRLHTGTVGVGTDGGGSAQDQLNGTAGAANTGGGGGGGGVRTSPSVASTNGGAGGSGIVVVRYPKLSPIAPFGASMRPRKAVQITSNGAAVFNGVVDDWDLDYSLGGDHVASVKITDGFVFLAGQEIEPHTTTAQTTGERIAAILDRAEIAWPPGKRAIDTGSATVQADAIGGTADPKPVPALPYLQKVDEAEQGALFIGADGSLTFRGRQSLQVLTDVVFADDGTGIPFTNINAAYGAEELRNRVTVSRLNGGTATATDAASVLAYGAIDFEIRDSLLADDTQAQSLADAIVARYAEPLLRIDDIEVVLNALTPAQVDQVLALELGALVRVLYTPSGIGDAIDQFVRLDQIEHNITAEQHRVRLSFSQGEPPALVLDSATFGLLDINTLGF
jgi:hypothetical protein